MPPVPAVSSDGLRTPLVPGAGPTAVGPGCTGCTLPPTTCPTVRTTVLFVVARGASHATNWLKTVGDTESSSHPDPEQMWWNVSCTQPPPFDSAFVTAFWRSARVHVV